LKPQFACEQLIFWTSIFGWGIGEVKGGRFYSIGKQPVGALMSWISIPLNLVTMGAFFDVSVRDILLALAAFTLARLTEVRQATATNSSAYKQGLVRATAT